MTGPKVAVLSILDGLSYGGDENRVLQIAQTIDRERFDFRVATIRPDDPGGNMRGEFERAGIPIVDLSVPRPTRGLRLDDLRRHVMRVGLLAATVTRIARYVRRERIDVIDGHHGAGYLTGTVAGVATGIPTLLTTYNVDEAWQPRWLYEALHRLTLAASGAVVTDSDAVAGELRAWMAAARRPRVRVIPNGPPPPLAVRADADVRATLGLRPRGETRVIGMVATLKPGKCQHLIVEAAPRILARHPDVTFLLVGYERRQQGYTAALTARVAELGIGANVIITPYKGPIGDVWQTVDIATHPSMSDSLPNAIIEAMACGKPVVASAHAGIPSLVLDGQTGFVVPVEDVDALAAALIRLLDAPDLARDFGAAGQARYADGYTPAHLTRRMENLFAELAAVRRR